MAIRLVSLNTWGGRVFEPLKKYLLDVNADLFCLQEVFSAPSTGLRSLADIDKYDVRVNLFNDIEHILPAHQGFFWPVARGYLNDSTSTEGSLFYGIATFVRKVIPIIESRTEFVFGEFRHTVSGGPPLPRNAHCIRLHPC